MFDHGHHVRGLFVIVILWQPRHKVSRRGWRVVLAAPLVSQQRRDAGQQQFDPFIGQQLDTAVGDPLRELGRARPVKELLNRGAS